MGSPWIHPRSHFSKIFNGILFGWILWIYCPNLKSVAFPVPKDNRGYTQKICAVPGYTHARSFLPNFSWAFIRMDPVIVLAKFEVRSFTSAWDNSDWSFGWGAYPQSWGRRGRRGSGMVPFERAKVSSYMPHIVTFYRAMHFSAKRGIAIVCCPSVRLSVRLSVTFRYLDHIGCNCSKIISRPNSLGPMWGLTQTWAIWCNRNTPKIGAV